MLDEEEELLLYKRIGKLEHSIYVLQERVDELESGLAAETFHNRTNPDDD